MGWLDIRNRIETPILGDDAATIIVNKFIEGKKFESITLKLSNHIEPIGRRVGEGVVTSKYRRSLDYELTRYVAKSLLKECDISKREKKVKDFIKDFGENLNVYSTYYKVDRNTLYRNIKELTVGDLLEISTMSNTKIDECRKNESSSIGAFLSYSLTDCFDLACLGNEGCGAFPIYPTAKYNSTETDMSGTFYGKTYSKRIYMNKDPRNINTWTFIMEYIKKCIDNRIPFHMKPLGPHGMPETDIMSYTDNLVLYSDDQRFDKHIEIIEDIIKEHPDVMKDFGTPIATGGMVKNSDGRCYYTVGHTVQSNMHFFATTYNKIASDIVKKNCVLSAIEFLKKDLKIKLNDLLKNEEISNDQKFKDLLMVVWNNSELNNRDCALYNALKKLYDNYFKLLSTVLKKYINEDKSSIEKISKRFRENYRKINSVTVFGDDRHIDTPIYMNEGFIQFNKKAESSIMFKYYKVYSAIIRARFPQAISMPEYKELSSDVKFLIKKVIDVSNVSSLTNMEIDIMDKSFLKLEKIATDITAKSGKEVYSYKVVKDNCFNGLISEDDFRVLRINTRLIYNYFPSVLKEFRKLSPDVRVILQKIRKADNPYELSLREMHIISSDSVKEQLDNIVNIIKMGHKRELSDMFDDRDDDISVVSKKNI